MRARHFADRNMVKRCGERAAALCCAAAVLVCVCVSACRQRPEELTPVRVAALNPLTGGLASIAPAWSDAEQLAAEHVNASGGVLGGRPLELVSLDSSAGGPADDGTAVALAALNDGAVALIGPATSGQSTAVLRDVVNAAQVPMVSCCATDTRLTALAPPNDGFFFRTVPSDRLQSRALANLAKHGTTVGGLDVPACPLAVFVNRGDEYGDGFAADFGEAYADGVVDGTAAPGQLLLQERYDPLGTRAITDMAAAHVRDAISAALDEAGALPEICVLAIGFPAETAAIIRRTDELLQALVTTQAAAAPALSWHYLVGDGAASSDFVASIGDLAPRVVGTVASHANDDAYAQFHTAYTSRFGIAPPAMSAQAYDAVMVLALAFAVAQTEDGGQVRTALFQASGSDGGVAVEGPLLGEAFAALQRGDRIDYGGPSGELTFDAYGDVRHGQFVLWQVEETAGGTGIVERGLLDP